jgi:membrane protein implicated in regulation of membrane protease activity
MNFNGLVSAIRTAWSEYRTFSPIGQVWILMMVALVALCLVLLGATLYYGGRAVAATPGWEFGPWAARATVVAVVAVVWTAHYIHRYVERYGLDGRDIQ